MDKKRSVIASDKKDLPRELRRIADTTFDRIWKFYFNTKTRIDLTEKEEEIRQRWEYVWTLSTDIMTRREIVLQLRSTYQITERQAYEDIINAWNLFGNPQDQVRKARREILSDILLKAMNKADKDSEYKALEKLALRYSRINGLDIDNKNDQLADFIKGLKPHTIIITGDPKSLQREADELMEGVEDIDSEVIEDNE